MSTEANFANHVNTQRLASAAFGDSNLRIFDPLRTDRAVQYDASHGYSILQYTTAAKRSSKSLAQMALQFQCFI
jgi:hypothetical protein